MSDPPIDIFRSILPAPGGTPLDNLRHVVLVFRDAPAELLAIQASSNVYDATEPGVIQDDNGVTYTGLTHGDLRALLASLDA